MKFFSKRILAAVLIVGWFTVSLTLQRALADETTNAKAPDVGNKASAEGKKVGNRVKEAVCTEGDAKCAAKKTGHRVDEAGDSISNKAKELSNKAD